MPKNEKHELVRDTIEDALDKPPSAGFLRAVRLGDEYEDELADQLIELFNRAGNNDQRSNLLQIWTVFAPTKTSAAVKLVKGVYIPMLSLGKQAFDIAYREVQLVIPPPRGAKVDLVAALKREAKVNRREKKVKKMLAEAGLLKNKKKWWTRGGEAE